MANPAKLPSLPQPATSLQPSPPAHDQSPRVAHLQLAAVPASAAEAYGQDIDAYLRSMESAPRPNKMALHTKRGERVTPALRAVLVKWLASLAPTLNFQSRTLHLAVLYLDRFLAAASATPAVRSVRGLFIIAAAALLVASKYEEIYPPKVGKLVYVTRRALGSAGGSSCWGPTACAVVRRRRCRRDELITAEVAVLKALQYELGAPTACTILEHFMERLDANGGDRVDSPAAQLASRLVELSLLDYGILRFRPSVVAASAILVTRTTARPSDDNPWGHEHVSATGYVAAELKECAEILKRLHRNSSQYASLSRFECLRKKYYKNFHFNCVCVWICLPLACIRILPRL